MDVLIEKLDGQQKRFSELGLIPRDFLVSAISLREYSSQITGRYGKIDKGADYDAKTIAVPFMFESADLASYPQKRDEIFAWLGGRDSFYIYEGRSEVETPFEMPGESNDSWSYQSDIDFSKRWLVRRTNDMTPTQQGLWGLSEITFSTVELPFGESSAYRVGRYRNPVEIIVMNHGNEAVDVEQGMDLVIEYTGFSTNLTLKNRTNSTEWNYKGSSVNLDKIRIDGINSTLSGLSIVRNTNLEFIRLEPGRNVISVEGAISGTLTFKFREYFR